MTSHNEMCKYEIISTLTWVFFISAIQTEQLQTSSDVDFSETHNIHAATLNYLLRAQQHAYLLRVFPFLFILLLQEVTDDLKEVLQRWWKGKYVTHPHTSITGTAARCFLKSWHINTMHSKRTVMDKMLTFKGDFYKAKMAVPAGLKSTGKFTTETMMVNHQRKDGICGSARTKTHLEPPAACSKHLMLEERSTSCNQKKKDERECLSSCVDCLLQQRRAGAAWGACLQ